MGKRSVSTVAITVMLGFGLTGCGGPQLSFQGQELEDIERSLEQLDQAWKQHVTDGVKANVSDESRCYLQVNDQVVSETAICGPIHYLGDDKTTWDSANWALVPHGGSGASALSAGDGFVSEQQPKGNTELYRPDGKEPPKDAKLAEPPAPTAAAGEPIWLPAGQTPAGSDDPVAEQGVLKSPIGTVAVTDTVISDRIGDAENRKQAPDGHQFLTIHFSTLEGFDPNSDKSSLAVAVGDKTYAIGAIDGQTVAIALPGNLDKASLLLGYDGLEQSLNLADMSRKSPDVAAGLYSDVASEPKDSDSRTGELTFGDDEADNTMSGSLDYSVDAVRLAYDEERKWPKNGKVWLKVTLDQSAAGMEWNGVNYLSADYDTDSTVQSPTVTFNDHTITGTIGDEAQGWSGGLEIWFQVPAQSSQFTFAADVMVSGPVSEYASADNAPARMEHLFKIRDVNLEFGPKTEDSEL